MKEMDSHPIYSKINLSKRMQESKAFSYFLKNVVITKPNQAWFIDIIYISMKRVFVFLTAVIDGLDMILKVSKPEILNSGYAEEITMTKFCSGM